MPVILAFSGGLDSTVLLWRLTSLGHPVKCLSVNYGQRHSRELQAAAEIAKLAEVEHRILDLLGIRSILGGSALTDPGIPVPEGHYQEESMRATVVPNRNMLLLSLCASWAISTGADMVAYAAHVGDHAIYPDCRPRFIRGMEDLFRNIDYKPIILTTPFQSFSKADIVSIGARLQAPLHLTWSCYKGGEVHCGRCGSCNERREAFELARVPDPTIYSC